MCVGPTRIRVLSLAAAQSLCERMGGSVCQIMAARRAPCQIVKVRLILCQIMAARGAPLCQIFGRAGAPVKKGRCLCQCWSGAVSNFGAPCGSCQSFGRAGAPVSNLQKKVVDVSRPTWRVKILAAAGPPCVKSPKKRSLMFLDRRCVSKLRPQPGPSVSNLKKKGRHPCQILGRRGPCVKFWGAGAPVSKCQILAGPGAPTITVLL